MKQRELLLSVSEVQELLGVSKSTVYKLLRDEELASFKLGRRRLIPREAVRMWIEKKTQEEG